MKTSEMIAAYHNDRSVLCRYGGELQEFKSLEFWNTNMNAVTFLNCTTWEIKAKTVEISREDIDRACTLANVTDRQRTLICKELGL